MSNTLTSQFEKKYLGTGETWADLAHRVATSLLGDALTQKTGRRVPADIIVRAEELLREKKIVMGGRINYATAARPDRRHLFNCINLAVEEDSRYGWRQIVSRTMDAFMTGAGIGVNYSLVRPKGSVIGGLRGTAADKASGSLSLMEPVDKIGASVAQGGSRRGATLALLHWKHGDIIDFLRVKRDNPTALTSTNLSVLLDDDFLDAYRSRDELAWTVWELLIEGMLTVGDPGIVTAFVPFEREVYTNACGEARSLEPNVPCVLGHWNVATVTEEERAEVINTLTLLLLGASVVSDVPFPAVGDVVEKYRQIGVGFFGLGSSLALHGEPYAPNDRIRHLLATWQQVSDEAAERWSRYLSISTPTKVRAIAPTGSSSAVAGVSSGIEPPFAHATARRFSMNGLTYVTKHRDSVTERLVRQGVAPSDIETAHDLGRTLDGLQRRLDMLALVQLHTDQAVSVTFNLPAPEERQWTAEQFSDLLMRYLPYLRGFTAYPNGSRADQPLQVIAWEEADTTTAVVDNSTQQCRSGLCGF